MRALVAVRVGPWGPGALRGSFFCSRVQEAKPESGQEPHTGHLLREKRAQAKSSNSVYIVSVSVLIAFSTDEMCRHNMTPPEHI